MDIPVIILAGGFGTRLRSVISTIPKPMAPIKGRPFLEYQLSYLEEQGVREVVLAVGYKAEIIETHFGARWQSINIKYSHEEAPLGTGGALIKACQLIPQKSRVFVLNGDSYYPASLDNMHRSHSERNAAVSIAVFKTAESQRYSSFDLGNDGILLRPTDRLSPYKSAGLYMFSSDIVSEFRRLPVVNISFEKDLMNSLWCNNERIVAYYEDCMFIDIGVPEDYLRASEIISYF